MKAGKNCNCRAARLWLNFKKSSCLWLFFSPTMTWMMQNLHQHILKKLPHIERTDLSIHISISSTICFSMVLSEDPSLLFTTCLLECTSSQCHITIQTRPCLWVQIKIPLFYWIVWSIPDSTSYIKILPQIRDKRASDPCAALTVCHLNIIWREK